MTRASVVLSFFFILAVVGTWSAASQGGIPWDQKRPIEWSDFLGIPPARPMAEAAMIDMRVSWRVQYVVSYDPSRGGWRGEVAPELVEVSNTMNPFGSWVISRKADPALLDHERRHFDLNEVYARRLQGELARIAASGRSADEVKQVLRARINETADRVLSTLTGMQELYDSETAHGTDLSAQASWDSRIDSWLYDPWSAPATVGEMKTSSGTMVVQAG